MMTDHERAMMDAINAARRAPGEPAMSKDTCDYCGRPVTPCANYGGPDTSPAAPALRG